MGNMRTCVEQSAWSVFRTTAAEEPCTEHQNHSCRGAAHTTPVTPRDTSYSWCLIFREFLDVGRSETSSHCQSISQSPHLSMWPGMKLWPIVWGAMGYRQCYSAVPIPRDMGRSGGHDGNFLKGLKTRKEGLLHSTPASHWSIPRLHGISSPTVLQDDFRMAT